jgi:hypothetical protein
LLEQARKPGTVRDPHVHLCRDRILSSEGDLRAVIRALLAPLPITARGVAIARRLLIDGTGPVYNPQCQVDLQAALRAAASQLDPALPLAVSV